MVTVYLRRKLHLSREVREKIAAGLERIKHCGLKIGSGKITFATMRCEDWAESWKRHFKPIEVGNRLLIKPSWSNRKPRKGQAVVVLDPGLSFGTGQHPTTAFCLNEIVKHQAVNSINSPTCTGIDSSASYPRPKRTSFLDLGTGSGILAIAAAKLGYSPVLALDFDSEAIRVARANASANRVRLKLEILYRDVTKLPICPRQRRQGHDLICANLDSNLLIAERHRIVAQLNATGTLVLAGVLKSEFTAVHRSFAALGLKLAASRSEQDWRSGAFRFARKRIL